MPKHHRDLAADDARPKPAFNRPPGARASPVNGDGPTTPKRTSREKAKNSPVPSPADRSRENGKTRKTSAPVKTTPTRDRVKYNSGTSVSSTSHLLSVDSLSRLNAINQKVLVQEKKAEKKTQKKQYKDLRGPEPAQQRRKNKKNRDVSGAIMEEGRAFEKRTRPRPRGGGYEKRYVEETGDGRRFNKKLWITIGVLVLLLVIFIPVGVASSKKSKTTSTNTATDTTADPSDGCDAGSIPVGARGTYTDITTWADTTDFNCTYSNDTVGDLPVMGLYSSWDDTTQANSNVPRLDQQWAYGQMPIRGVNLGGWLDLEPFITPSMFNYPAVDNIVDEWTLMEKLGATASRVIEAHYLSFVTKQTFIDIQNAGLDHVRIPYPYWAVATYEGDPYVPRIAWRYLLRGIEWARECGLRINLDLHSVPGSQNGWAHSGHQGSIGWLTGVEGALNGQRSLDIHNQLSQFFAQERYKNVITIYGLVNEPKMLVIPVQSVTDWSTQAVELVRRNGISQWVTFGDGFLKLTDWTDMFKGVDDKLVMDTHQYQIFNVPELALTHQNKIKTACEGWSQLMSTANNPSTGWGPTLDGEWSQADTDCTQYLNNIGIGSRWAGTLNTGDLTTSVTTQSCASPPCSCAEANADPSTYSDSYKQFLQMYAEAQMYSFEKAWGWFYWTWQTESAAQWSWKLGLAAGILPAKACAPSFRCDSAIPSFSDLSESY